MRIARVVTKTFVHMPSTFVRFRLQHFSSSVLQSFALDTPVVAWAQEDLCLTGHHLLHVHQLSSRRAHFSVHVMVAQLIQFMATHFKWTPL